LAVRQAGLRRTTAAGKAAATVSERPMIGIAAIVVFLIVMFALNRYEFGRFD
jgi:ribose/xylose/arabinose/galactoside ABC-type transport system permease subunit